MKLLIVDDEEITRSGIVSSIDWKSLGIREIYQADDGMNGLEMARKYRPEIILCDVRMPRMDGITMLERLSDLLPNTVSIFMSGYSDKEYLKAAIKLKAITYIEKPLDPDELKEAVSDAIVQYVSNFRSNQAVSFQSRETASRLALCLTSPYEPIEGTINGLLSELSLSDISDYYFTAYIVRMDRALETLAFNLSELYQQFQHHLGKHQLDCIFTEKKHQYLVFFVYGQSNLSQEEHQSIAEYLKELFCQYDKCYIIAGEPFAGIHNAYLAYTSTVIIMQSSFFFPENSILSYNNRKDADPSFLDKASNFLNSNPDTQFREALFNKNQDACLNLLEQTYSVLFKNTHLLPNQAKDLYYKLFVLLDDALNAQQIHSGNDAKSLTAFMEECFSFESLHKELCEMNDQYFSQLGTHTHKNPTVLMIEEFIQKNYANEYLSVKDISDHVNLSTSYLCTFFKNETGQTLNQYLTEHRMEKAKQLLQNPRYKISEISSMVGYSDGNYFGKSFRKYTGLSPSEYRERTS